MKSAPIIGDSASLERLSGRFLLSRSRAATPGPVFPDHDSLVAEVLVELWKKYSEELAMLAAKLAQKYRAMTAAGLGAAFGDREGEFLYILVRELQPELVFEISPNTGYSTNYLLAALTANQKGRMESFELITEFGGRPTEEVVKGNLVDLCDPRRININLGDARITTLERLRNETPQFTLIDSCHDDFFAEYYVKELFPRLSGWVAVQDIAHFDQRAERAGEAFYLLSYFQKTATNYLLLGLYDDELAVVADDLARRRPLRSNTILLELGERRAPASVEPALPRLQELSPATARAKFPLNAALDLSSDLTGFEAAEGAPEDDFVAVYYGGREVTSDSWCCDLIALAEGRAALPEAVRAALLRQLPTLQWEPATWLAEALAGARDREGVVACSRALAEKSCRGGVLLMRLARACHAVGLNDDAWSWVERARRAAPDGGVSVNYRILFEAASLSRSLGRKAEADIMYSEGLSAAAARQDAALRKASVEAWAYALRHPNFLPLLMRSPLSSWSGLLSTLQAKAAAMRRNS